MKILIASDVHGSARFCSMLAERIAEAMEGLFPKK